VILDWEIKEGTLKEKWTKISIKGMTQK